MAKTTTVRSASNGVTYTARLLEKGDHHGLNFCKTHQEDRPIIEFYDLESKAASYDFVGTREEAIAAGAPKLGQFVSSYYVHTLLENIATTSGICLHGGVPRWVIDGDAVRQAFQDLGLWKPFRKRLIVVWDSNDPDTEPTVWGPREMLREWEVLPLNKSQELGGRYPNTDPADILLLDAGSHAAYPDYVQLP